MLTTLQVKAAFFPALFVALALPLKADTLYQTTAQGREQVIQRNAIVVSQDPYSIVYKHFDLPDMRVEKVRLSKGSLPYTVDISTPQQRQGIVNLWKQFGYTASVTDASGKTTLVYDVYIDFYPPHGEGSLLAAVSPLTSFPLQLDAGGADVEDFSRIARVDFQNGKITLTLKNGRVEHGTFLMPTTKPAEARFLGITDKYDPASEDVFDFSEPLYNLKSIVFQQ
ncbi:MAG: hypothetical protein P8Z30_00045 [Acidobacteriota bacterium]